MKKILLIASMTAGLTACASSPAPEEDSRLKEAYSACINTAQGSPEKIEACQSVLNVLKKSANISNLLTKKACGYWTISSAFRRRARVTIRRSRLTATRSGRKFAVIITCNKNLPCHPRANVFRPWFFRLYFLPRYSRDSDVQTASPSRQVHIMPRTSATSRASFCRRLTLPAR